MLGTWSIGNSPKASKTKKLLFLGAGPHQVPAIRKAVEIGLTVITLDYLPENIGHRYSHQYINLSTVDKEGILEAAAQLDIDGIVTVASDIATPTVGFVAEQLGLPGCGLGTAVSLSNKGRFRQLQASSGLDHPRFVLGERLKDVIDKFREMTLPLMFKPVDTSGSRGVSKIEAADDYLYLRAFEHAQAYSASGVVCVEEYLDGTEVGGDGFLQHGELAFAAVTHKHKQGFVVTGHSLPTNIGPKEQNRVLEEIAANCRAAGYGDGPLNFDVIVSERRTTVVEMSPRLGGNGIPALIEHATGVDLIEVTLRFAVGENTAIAAAPGIHNPSGSWVFGSGRAGVVEDIATEEQVRLAVPEVVACCIHCRVGDRVEPFVHNGNSLGYMVFDCQAPWGYSGIVAQLQNALRLQVAESSRCS